MTMVKAQHAALQSMAGTIAAMQAQMKSTFTRSSKPPIWRC